MLDRKMEHFISVGVFGCLKGWFQSPTQLASDWLAGAACLTNCHGCIQGSHPWDKHSKDPKCR